MSILSWMVRLTMLVFKYLTSLIHQNHLKTAASGIRLAARLTDMPPNELNCDTYVEEAKAIQRKLENKGVSILVKQGQTLKVEGLDLMLYDS